jgi:hypothetical protein
MIHYNAYADGGWQVDPQPQEMFSSSLPFAEDVIAVRIAVLRYTNKCPNCTSALVISTQSHTRGVDGGNGKLLHDMWVVGDEISYSTCPNCGWWYSCDYLHCQADFEESFHCDTKLVEGVLKVCDPNDFTLALDELRRHILRRPDAVRQLSPRAFEELVQSIYRDFFHCEVKYLGGAGDQGIDLVVILGHQRELLLQVKRTRHHTLVDGPEYVRALIGASALRGGQSAHLVTSASRFTPATQDVAKRARKLRMHSIDISLVHLDTLMTMMEVSCRREALLKSLRNGTE